MKKHVSFNLPAQPILHIKPEFQLVAESLILASKPKRVYTSAVGSELGNILKVSEIDSRLQQLENAKKVLLKPFPFSNEPSKGETGLESNLGNQTIEAAKKKALEVVNEQQNLLQGIRKGYQDRVEISKRSRENANTQETEVQELFSSLGLDEENLTELKDNYLTGKNLTPKAMAGDKDLAKGVIRTVNAQLEKDKDIRKNTDRLTLNRKRLVEFFEGILGRIEAIEQSNLPVEETLRQYTDREEAAIDKQRFYCHNPMQMYVDHAAEMDEITKGDSTIENEVMKVMKWLSESEVDIEAISANNSLLKRYQGTEKVGIDDLIKDKLKVMGVLHHLKHDNKMPEVSPLVSAFFEEVVGGFYQEILSRIDGCIQAQKSHNVRTQATRVLDDAERLFRQKTRSLTPVDNEGNSFNGVCGTLVQIMDKVGKNRLHQTMLTEDQHDALALILSKVIKDTPDGVVILERAAKFLINDFFRQQFPEINATIQK